MPPVPERAIAAAETTDLRARQGVEQVIAGKVSVTITKTADGKGDYVQLMSEDMLSLNVVVVARWLVRPARRRGGDLAMTRAEALERLYILARKIAAREPYQHCRDCNVAHVELNKAVLALAAVELAAPEGEASRPGCSICGEPIICTETFCPPHAQVAPSAAYETLDSKRDQNEIMPHTMAYLRGMDKQRERQLADARAAAVARDALTPLLPFVATHNWMLGAYNEAAERVALALDAFARERIERYALIVDDPRSMHLHYDGCPFKPYAAAREDDIPDPRPDCTCAEAHMAAYWKGQWVLERGQRELDVREREAAVWEAAAKIMESRRDPQAALLFRGRAAIVATP